MIKQLLQLTSRLLAISARNPRDLKHVFGIANWAAGEVVNPVADTRSLPHVEVLDICPGTSRWMLQSFPSVGASVSPLECAALAALLNLVQAKRVFEFGTYKGVSTTQLLLNIGNDGIVFTLDLPEDHPEFKLPIPRPEERAIALEGEKGILIPKDLRNRVTFLQSDSATFDETPYLESMDFVFVDGAHSHEYVRNDTLKGWRMLRAGGIIAWHDVAPNHPGVVQHVKECGYDSKLVSGTSLAYACKS